MAFVKYLPLLLLSATGSAQSFSFSNLFGQASKQKNYYLQQIAAYNALHAELKQGYNIMKNGLGGIRDINTGELNAHTAYYTSLKTPSSSVENNTQVKGILTYQTYIGSSFSQNVDGLTTDENIYVTNVKNKVLTDCKKDLNDLQNLLNTNKLELSDDERLKRLNAIHASMLDKYEFSRSFTNSLKILAIRRQQHHNNTQTLTSLYENH